MALTIEFNKDTFAVVTGASKGIGLACAQALAAAGARCVLVARNPEVLAGAVASLPGGAQRHTGYPADLSDGEAAAALVSRIESELGPIDILINSAGAANRYPAEELSPAAFAQGMQAKYFPTVHLLEPVAKRMAARSRGSIVNIIGQGGKQAAPIHIAGGSANAALMLATVGYAKVYAPSGVRVNAINPGLTNTTRVSEGMDAAARSTGESLETVLQKAQENIPMGRMAEPSEIASVAAFLASDLASYVTGAIVPMDGGGLAVI